MKASWYIFWLLSACIFLTEARYKMRRPLLPHVAQPPPQSYKKPWPISHRMSMGNTLHIGGGGGGGNFGPKRQIYKPAGYRIRRPPATMYNVLQTSWKNQVPVVGVMNHGAAAAAAAAAGLPQRPPVKEFHPMNKIPEYSPEYRPETVVMPPTHRGGMDDDKGAIHTIPAPNLSLADKPYSLGDSNDNPGGEDQRHYQNDAPPYNNANIQGSHVTNFGFGSLVTSATAHRTMTSPSSTANVYDVTESNEIIKDYQQTGQPTFYTGEFEATRLAATPLNPDLRANELFVNQQSLVHGLKPTGLVNTNVQFGQSNAPMQTNLHSSLHVGFPGTAGQAPSSLMGAGAAAAGSGHHHQVPDLHVGHPAPAGPPLSATQLYDLLNSFPHQVNEQYIIGQQPAQLQQQIGQLFQPTGTGTVTTFSQPQMHSFNYDEQANKQQQQQQQKQILIGEDYATGRVTADYNLEPETAENAQSSANIHLENVNGNNVNSEELGYGNSEASGDQDENHIEYEESGNERGGQLITSYLSNGENEDSVATQFYTTLPNKEAAEKLAALAAAGNVNSHLIGQIRKQQQDQQRQQQLQQDEAGDNDTGDDEQSDEPMPVNNNDKHNEYEVNEPQDDDVPYNPQQQQRYRDQQDQQQQRYDEKQQLYDQQQYHRESFRRHQQELNHQYEQQRYSNRQRENNGGQVEEDNGAAKPMRIMVPEVEKYSEEEQRQRTASETENTSEDYDYENPEADVVDGRTTISSDGRTTHNQNPSSPFGTRLTAIKPQ